MFLIGLFLVTIPFSSIALTEHYPDTLQETMPVVRESQPYEDLIRSMNVPYKAVTPAATRFYFVRHGESMGNKERIYAGQTLDVDLTEKGEKDAILAGEKLRKMQQEEGWAFDNVFSSSSLRAIRTTEIALSQLSSFLKCQTDMRLMEKHGGKFDGKPMGDEYSKRTIDGEAEVEKLSTFWEKFNFKHDPSDLLEETLRQVYDRATEFLHEKNADSEFQGKNILVGSHGGLLKSLVMADAALNHGLILEYHRFDAPNGTLLVIEVEDGKMKVIYTDGFKYRSKQKYVLPASQ